MSTYARQFLDQMERPPVGDIRNVLPAVALEARNSVRNARSTVGTITEIHDVLRLLFANLGEVTCPAGHGAGAALSPPARWPRSWPREWPGSASSSPPGSPGRRRGPTLALAELVRQGFARRLEGGEILPLAAAARAGPRRATR